MLAQNGCQWALGTPGAPEETFCKSKEPSSSLIWLAFFSCPENSEQIHLEHPETRHILGFKENQQIKCC